MVNMLLGVWLAATAVLWPHQPGEYHNAWITGLAMVGVAVLGVRVAGARWADAALALWLFSSTFVFAHATGATVLNDMLVAMAALIVSFLPFSSVTPPTEAWSVPPNADV
jgi:hypothetical protein